jgi:Ca2+-binding EF-hand superfamily protein
MVTRAENLVALLLLSLSANAALAQQGGFDLDKSIIGRIKDVYRAPFEVPKDLASELRGYYKNPTPQREEEILKEVRRLFMTSPKQEEWIIREVRRSYEQWSPEQEARIYKAIERAPRLPEGSVHPTTQANSAVKLFNKLDRDGNGTLSTDELPDTLRADRARWDADRDGMINWEEFSAYYQGRLRWLSEEVAAGRIDLGLKRGGPMLQEPSKIIEEDDSKPLVIRACRLPPGLPEWFFEIDVDKDGQIAFHEWRKSGRPLEDFALLDANDDGFATAEEVLRYMETLRKAGDGAGKK